MILSAFENRLNTQCKQIQPLSRIKTLNGPRVRRISPVGKEKVYGGNDLPKSQHISLEFVAVIKSLITKFEKSFREKLLYLLPKRSSYAFGRD